MAYLIAPLANVKMTDTLIIDSSLRIDKTPVHVTKAISEARQRGYYRHPIKYDHCLVITDYSPSGNDSKSREILQRIVTLLRIYMPGDVFYSGGIIDKSGWYNNPKDQILNIFGIFVYMVWDSFSLYEITKDNRDALVDFVRTHKKNKILKQSPFRLFFKGYHEPFPTDRFLDNAIGLESLLVNDGDRSNFKYKFVDRGCYLLKQALSSQDTAAVFAERLSNIYDIRSKLVHNRESSFKKNDFLAASRDADQFLRVLLSYVLDNPGFINSKEIDDAKRALY